MPLLLVVVLIVYLLRDDHDNHKTSAASLKKTINKAEKIAEENPDSAIKLYTMLVKQYNPELTPEEKMLIIDSQVRKWDLCFNSTHNYAEAYRALSEAHDMMMESGLLHNDVYSRMGILLNTFSMENNDTTLMRESFRNFHKAYANEIEVDRNQLNILTIDMLFANIILEARMIDSLDVIDTEMKGYLSLPEDTTTPMRLHNRLLYEGYKYQKNKQYDQALMCMDSILSIIPDEPLHVYTKIMGQLNKSDVLMDMHRPDEAIVCLDSAFVLAHGHDAKDALMDIYSRMATAWEAKGNDLNKTIYQNKYYGLKDSLTGYQPLDQINSINTGRELDKMQSRMVKVDANRRVERNMIYLGVVLLVALSGFVYVLSKRNRRLLAANRKLYSINEENITNDKERNELRRNYETRIQSLSSQLTEAKEHIKTFEDDPEGEPEPSQPATERETPTSKTSRYRNSTIDDERKNMIMNTILSVMENTEEWMNPDFSIKQLGDMTGHGYKVVSQIINEVEGRNFNTFVNNYRIDEACRRITDTATFGNLTLDAISKSVGFKARSSFISAFRRKTGMTPSEYQKIAHSSFAETLRERRNHPENQDLE